MAALFFTAAFAFCGMNVIESRAADAQAAAEAQAALEAQQAAEAQAALEAQRAAEAQAALEAQRAAEAQAALEAQQAAANPGGEALPGTQPSLPRQTGSSYKNSILTEQVKQDIENSLERGAQDAVINGYLSLLNKDYILKDELDPDLVSIGGSHKLERRAASFVMQMVKDAWNDGIYINVTSSYRTYIKQVSLFKNKIARLEREGYTHAQAVQEAGTVVAVPGTSEHQLGLSLDFVTGNYRKLDEGIRNTKEYRWIEEHAWEYGYVIRYPKGKSDITGIISEPWHLRYVGIPAAKLMTEQELCLEEFLGVAYDGQKSGISYGAGWANTGR